MTKEEAIQILIESKDETIERTMQEWDEYDKKLYQAIDMAIEALKAEPSTEGRYEKAIKTLQEMPKYINSNIIGKKLEVFNYTKKNKNGEINEK